MTGHNDAAARVTAYLDARAAFPHLDNQIAEAKSGGAPWTRLTTTDLRAVLAELAEARRQNDEASTRVAELEGELDPGEPVTDTVQLVLPRGPILDGMKRVLDQLGIDMAGPLPLEREPIPTYVLQPRLVGEWTEAEDTSSKEQDDVTTRYAWESSTGTTHLVENLNHAKAIAAAEYCAFVASYDPQAKPIVEWRAGPGPAFWMLYADGESTTWLIRRVTSTIPADYGA